MKCEKCGSDKINFTNQTYTQSKRRSCLWNTFMFCITAGLWLIWMLVRKKKEKVINNTVAVCQNCGNTWKVNND